MSRSINREALQAFVEVLDRSPQSLISFEHAVEMMTAIGFSCRLACEMENWNQRITFFGPPADLAPLEAEVETPIGHQRITLEPGMELAATVRRALEEIRHLQEAIAGIPNEGVDATPHQELVERVREMERTLVHEIGRFQRSGTFKWPMDRFQLLIEHEDRSARVTACGPLMAALSRSWLADATAPGISVRDMGESVVTLLTDRTIERGRSVGAGFRAREEATGFVQVLRDYLLTDGES